MSDKLMETEPGGESSQYESIKTVTSPHSKQGGQLGDPQTITTTDQRSGEEKSERASRTAENIRYGQTISEGGMGGQTTGIGVGVSQGGFGGAKDASASTSGKQERRAEGYGGSQDMDRNVGA